MQATADHSAGASPAEEPDLDTTSVGAPTSNEARPRWGRELVAVGAVLATIAAVVYRVWERAWDAPFVHAGDGMAHLALLETVGWTGTPAPNPGLGAPYQVDWADMPSGADRLHLVVLRALRALTGDTVVAANAYLLLSIVAVGLVAYVVLRQLRCSPLASGVAAVVFAVAPAQFARAGVGHLFLANYVAVPTAVWLALWASDAVGERRRGWRAWVAPTVAVLVLGSASAYYAIFGVVVIGSVGLVRALRRWSWRPAARPVATSVATLAVVVVNVAGEAMRRGGDAGVRVPLDSDAFGLRVSQMLLPLRDHRIGPLADWADRAYRVAAPGDRGATLGLLSIVGLAAILLWCVRRVGRPVVAPDLLGGDLPGRRGVIERLGVVAVSAVAVGTVGGFGMVVATLGITQIRAWSRIAILVGFVGASGLAMLLDGGSRRWSPGRPARLAVAVVLVCGALVDQVGTSVLPGPADNESRWATDQELAGDLQTALPEGAMVFQLPVGTFPAELPLGSISANDLLAPQVAGDGSLRWSVGAMNGRDGDWQRTVAALPPEEMVVELAAAGVAALAVDRRGFDDGGETLDAALASLVGEPAFESEDGTRAWYDLRPLHADLVRRDGADAVARRGAAVVRPLGVVVEGSPGVRSTGDARARHLGPASAIVVTDTSADAGAGAPISIAFTLDGAAGSNVRVTSSDGDVRTVELGEEPAPVSLEVRPGADGTARVSLRTDAPPLPEVDSWGDLRVRLGELMVRDARLVG